MNKCFLRLALTASIAMALAGCGNKETKEALQKATALENQQQYHDANGVLVDALQAREVKIRAGLAVPTNPSDATALTQKVQADPEVLKLERAQIPIYLHLEQADLASAVYTDILAGSPGDSVVYDALSDKDPVIRTGAVRVLGLAQKPDAIPTLVEATKDKDKDVRRAAVAALGTIKNPATVGPLIASLKDSYWFARSEAAEALEQEKDPRAIKPLLDTVADADSNVRSSAESSLLLLCTVPGVSAEDFASRLNDPNSKIVMISAVCLALRQDPRAVPVLMKLAASPDLTTRLQAIKGLGETGDPSVLPLLRQTLKDSDVNMRGWSILGLGHMKDQEALPALRAIAADVSEPATIQKAARDAVAYITGEQPTPGGP